VRRREGVGHLRRDVENPLSREEAASERGTKRLSLQQLRDRVVDAARLADVEERDDVRMREGGDGFRSCSKRESAWASFATSSGSTLTATSRSSRVSRAR
jgi:hypothetical protein